MCKPCYQTSTAVKARALASYHLNPEPKKDATRECRRRRLYGMDDEDYEQMAARQDYRCAICMEYPGEAPQGLVIDHNHVTNQVRDLLCNSCNIHLNVLEKDQQWLLMAIQYLKDHGTDFTELTKGLNNIQTFDTGAPLELAA